MNNNLHINNKICLNKITLLKNILNNHYFKKNKINNLKQTIIYIIKLI